VFLARKNFVVRKNDGARESENIAPDESRAMLRNVFGFGFSLRTALLPRSLFVFPPPTDVIGTIEPNKSEDESAACFSKKRQFKEGMKTKRKKKQTGTRH
jgi:hypothetical protein